MSSKDTSMKLNPWQGIVKAIHHGNMVSEVTLEMAPNVSVTASVSNTSVKSLGLEIGAKAYALIESTEIALAID
jgi:molybdopterin-binding protein